MGGFVSVCTWFMFYCGGRGRDFGYDKKLLVSNFYLNLDFCVFHSLTLPKNRPSTKLRASWFTLSEVEVPLFGSTFPTINGKKIF